MKCRVCKCTQERACANGCGWARGEGDLCTNCAVIAEMIREYREVAYRFSLTRLMAEANRPIGRVMGARLAAEAKRRASGAAS